MSPSSKIHPNLARLLDTEMAMGIELPTPPLRIIVRHAPTPETRAATAAIGGVQSVLRPFGQLVNGSALLATRDAIRILALRPDVDMIWLDEPVHTMIDVSVPLVQVPALWSAGLTGQRVKVGIVDTGIDPDHPDFAGRILVNRDFTGEGARDNNGHGTHVAGIVGGSGVNSSSRYRGIAPDSQLLVAKVLKGDGSGFMSDVIAGLEFMVEQNVQVINLSLGGAAGGDGTDALSVACDSAVGRGIPVCVAVGNGGPSSGTVASPGCARLVITIGATDKQDSIAAYSSRGPTSDGRVKPDVYFPGSSIHSCRAKGTSMGEPIDDFYTTASGSSMATPHAAGVCALLLQANPTLAPDKIKNALLTTAKNLGAAPNTDGIGRANAFAAYQLLTSSQPKPQPPSPPPQPPTQQVPPPVPPPPLTPPNVPPPVQPPPVSQIPSPPDPQPAPAPGGCLELLRHFLRG